MNDEGDGQSAKDKIWPNINYNVSYVGLMYNNNRKISNSVEGVILKVSEKWKIIPLQGERGNCRMVNVMICNHRPKLRVKLCSDGISRQGM